MMTELAAGDQEVSAEPVVGGPAPFAGASHADVLAMRFDEAPSELIVGLIPRGVLVTIAGLPETYKGWVATKAAANVAGGAGDLLGCQTIAQGPVGYFWNDDSTRNEAERIQLFAARHNTPADLPLVWFLNEDVSLPRDVDRLRSTVLHHGLVLVVLDSVYNFTSELDLKDRDVGALYARLKAEICDPTDCTIVLVDHMPWKTDANRSRLRGYGDVFKNAAIRAGIYIDADGSKLYVEARGNSIRGFKRTPAYWDPDTLELRLVDTSRQDEADEELDQRVLQWLTEHPGRHSTSDVRVALDARGQRVDKALERLESRDDARVSSQTGGPLTGRPREPKYWEASIHAADESSRLFGTTPDDPGARVPERGASSQSSHPRRGDDAPRDDLHARGNGLPTTPATALRKATT
jgi:hypothetical protein